jgi:hypothetical protein
VRNWFTTLDDGISDTPGHFVYNMDEMSHYEYADSKPIQCVAPAYMADTPYYEAYSQNPMRCAGKKITLIACFAAEEFWERPVLILPHKVYGDELLEYVFAPQKIEAYSQNHPYIDSDVCPDWRKDF